MPALLINAVDPSIQRTRTSIRSGDLMNSEYRFITGEANVGSKLDQEITEAVQPKVMGDGAAIIFSLALRIGTWCLSVLWLILTQAGTR